MANTTYAMLGQFNGQTLQQAFAQLPTQANNLNLDLIQIVSPGDQSVGTGPTVVLNVDYTGVVHNPAVSPTNGTRLGVFESLAPASSSTALYFSTAFSNLAQNDILQVRNLGGNISYWLDYLGVAHGS